jgi:hypothetical protein
MEHPASLFCVVALLTLAPSEVAPSPPLCSGREAAPGLEVRFDLHPSQIVVVPVLINGTGPFEFLLDTGTDTTIVEPELAKSLRIRPNGRTVLETVAGSKVVLRGTAATVSLGPVSRSSLDVLIDEIASVRGLRREIRGLLGQDFLARVNFLIDYGRRRITFELAGEIGSRLRGTRLSFGRIDNLITLEGRAGAPPGRRFTLVLDSAAPSVILFGPYRADPLATRAAATAVAGTSFRTSLPVRRGELRDFVVGDIRLGNRAVALLPSVSPAGTRREDGLLPASLFRAVYVNQDEGFVILNPRDCES